MRRVFFWLFIILIVLWTFFIGSTLIHGVPTDAELAAMSEAERQGAKAGAGLGTIFELVIWAIIVVPLGIFALIAKPRSRGYRVKALA
jgi:ABC-type phosphate transport system permease subunit